MEVHPHASRGPTSKDSEEDRPEYDDKEDHTGRKRSMAEPPLETATTCTALDVVGDDMLREDGAADANL